MKKITLFFTALLLTHFVNAQCSLCGIGTSSPTSKLHIRSCTQSSSTSGLNVADSNNQSLFFVRDDGNIGIRNNSPTSILDISASTSSKASVRIREGTRPTSPNIGDIWLTNGTLLELQGGFVSRLSLGNTFFGFKDKDATGNGAFRGAINLASTSADWTFYTATGNGGSEVFTERLRIKNSDGSIGIGTASPVVPFHSNIGHFRITDPASGTRAMQINVNYAGSGDIPAGAFQTSLTSTSGEGLTLLPYSGGSSGVKIGAAVYTGSAWKSIWESKNETGSIDPSLLLIKSGGKVGIGTASPNSKVDIAGDQTLKVWIGTSSTTMPDGNTNPRLVLGDAVGASHPGLLSLVSNETILGGYVGVLGFSNYAIAGTEKRLGLIGTLLDGASNNGAMNFFTMNTGTIYERMRISKDGYVGIGSTAPASKLEINGAGSSYTIDGIRLRQPNVAHGMTNYVATDVYGNLGWISSTYGGAYYTGFTDADGIAMIISGATGSISPTIAPVDIRGRKKNGADFQALSNSEKMISFTNHATIVSTMLGNGSLMLGATTSPNVMLDVNGGLATRPGSTVNITSDNQVVTVGNVSYLRLSSDAAAGDTRTIVLTQGLQQGQRLSIEFTGTNQAELLDDGALSGGGNQRMAGNLTLTQYDVIELIWNGTDWVETSRSVN